MSSRKSQLWKIAVAAVLCSVLSEQRADAFTLQTYQKEKRIKVENLSLQQALEKLRYQGPEIIQLKSELQGYEEAYRKAKYSYWMPSGDFTASIDSQSTVARFKGAFPEAGGTQDKFFGPTSGSASVTLFKYTISDGGLATLELEKNKLEYEAKVKEVTLKRNKTERDLVKSYSKIRTLTEQLDVSYRGYQLWQTVEQLMAAGAGAGSGGLSESDKNEVKIQLNDAEKDFGNYASALLEEYGVLNTLLGEPPQKRYNLSTEIKYAPLEYSQEDALAQIEKTSLDAVQKRYELQSERIASQKEIMDLGFRPKLEFGGLVFKYNFMQNSSGSAGVPTTVTAGDDNSSNFNVSFSMSISANLFGPEGFFKHFAREESQRRLLAKEQEIRALRLSWQKRLNDSFNDLSKSRNDLRLGEASLKDVTRNLDLFLDRLSKGEKTSVRDIKDAVGESLKRNIDLLEKRHEALGKRVDLDELLGVDTMKLLGETKL